MAMCHMTCSLERRITPRLFASWTRCIHPYCSGFLAGFQPLSPMQVYDSCLAHFTLFSYGKTITLVAALLALRIPSINFFILLKIQTWCFNIQNFIVIPVQFLDVLWRLSSTGIPIPDLLSFGFSSSHLQYYLYYFLHVISHIVSVVLFVTC